MNLFLLVLTMLLVCLKCQANDDNTKMVALVSSFLREIQAERPFLAKYEDVFFAPRGGTLGFTLYEDCGYLEKKYLMWIKTPPNVSLIGSLLKAKKEKILPPNIISYVYYPSVSKVVQSPSEMRSNKISPALGYCSVTVKIAFKDKKEYNFQKYIIHISLFKYKGLFKIDLYNSHINSSRISKLLGFEYNKHSLFFPKQKIAPLLSAVEKASKNCRNFPSKLSFPSIIEPEKIGPSTFADTTEELNNTSCPKNKTKEFKDKIKTEESQVGWKRHEKNNES